MPKQTKNQPSSHHILPTAANLLGFTFLVLVSVKSLGVSQTGFTDKLTGLCVILFALSTLLSFLSIRSVDRETMINYEKWAERLFLLSLMLCTVLTILIVFDVLKIG